MLFKDNWKRSIQSAPNTAEDITLIKRERISKPFLSNKFYDIFFSAQFLLIMYLICIHVSYVAAKSSENYFNFGDDMIDAAGGSPARQLFYIIIFGLGVLVSLSRQRSSNIQALSIPYFIACLWCLLSALWAISPSISIRRSVGMLVILFSLVSAIEHLGAKHTLRLVYVFLSTAIVASIISILLNSHPLFSFSIHPDDEMDRALVGNWKGIFRHKNVTGAVMAHAFNFFLFYFLVRKRLVDLLFAFLAGLILYKSNSLTSGVLVVVALIVSIFYLFVVNTQFKYRLQIFGVSAFLLSIFSVSAAIFELNAIRHIVSDPESISGRMEIWQTLVKYIKDHFILGSGYGSFYGIGVDSPMFKLAKSNYVYGVGHSHSGYFEVIVTTGFIGLLLAVFALIAVPAYRFMAAPKEEAWLSALCLSLWTFGILQNFTEAMFFAPDKESWAYVVVAITIIHTRAVARSNGNVQWLQDTAWGPTPRLKPQLRKHYKVDNQPSRPARSWHRN